jgi:hypothetical protein
MSFTYLDDRSVYEERYDKLTVELCRDRENMVENLLGERPPLDSQGEADPANGYHIYSMMYFQFVEALAGERWQEREATINEWMAEDEAKDRGLENARPAATPYCRSCDEDMEVTSRVYHQRTRGGRSKGGHDDILFMFDCRRCNKRVASWQDGTEWKPPQARCEQCRAAVEETDKRRGNTITTTYACGNCGHNHKSTLRLGAREKTEPDLDFKLDRRRFCFDAATGQKFLERKTHIEHIRKLLEQGQQQASGEPAFDPVAAAVKDVRRLKVAQLADLLAKAVAKDEYSDFKLGELQVGPEVAVPFSCLDNRPERGDYDSRTSLKKLVTTALADTNWQLMSQGVSHRLGYLSGRLRAYESEDDLRKLVEKQLKAGTRKTPVTQPAPIPELPAQPEPPSTPKRSRRGKQRAIRVRGILHHNLHILIPPREAKKPSPKTKGKKQ